MARLPYANRRALGVRLIDVTAFHPNVLDARFVTSRLDRDRLLNDDRLLDDNGSCRYDRLLHNDRLLNDGRRRCGAGNRIRQKPGSENARTDGKTDVAAVMVVMMVVMTPKRHYGQTQSQQYDCFSEALHLVHINFLSLSV